MKAHICGIGGEGWSWIAKVLIEKGWEVTGCDLNKNERVKSLIKLGLKDFKQENSVGHIAANLDYVLYYSALLAYPKSSIEIEEGKRLGIKTLDREEFLPVLLKD